MTNKKFISKVLMILFLFVAMVGGTGCGGGSSLSPVANEEPNNFVPSPEEDEQENEDSNAHDEQGNNENNNNNENEKNNATEQESNNLINIDELSGDLSVEYNENKQIVNIEGNYSNFTISNTNDALRAISVLRNNLGISNPANELETFCITSDNSGAEYQFRQVYNGVPVFGRGLMVSANSKGNGDFLHSNLLSSDITAKVDAKTCISSSDAEAIAKANYTGDVTVDADKTEKIIYSLGDYEAEAVYAYIVRIYGTNGDDNYIDESVFVNAESGLIICNFTNLLDASHQILTTKFVSSDNELGQDVSFPITLSNQGEWQMIDTADTPRIEIYSGDANSSNIFGSNSIVKCKPGDEIKQDWDKQAVSAYTNIRDIMHWWKDNFNRNSLDNKGMTVEIVVHQNVINVIGTKYLRKDIASWNSSYKRIYIDDVSWTNTQRGIPYSSATATDILTHETTHAVIQYDIQGGLPYENITGAINEGYADIFGCIQQQDWLIADACYSSDFYNCTRDIRDPHSDSALSTSSLDSTNVKGPRTVAEHVLPRLINI